MSAILITKEQIDLKTNSAAREVIVYTNRAEVKRSLTCKLAAGENNVSFRNLGKGIDEDSIKAAVNVSGARITAIFLEQNQLYFFRETEHEKLYHEILATLKDCARVLDEKSLCALENKLLTELREYIREILNPILLKQDVALVKLNEALAFLNELTCHNHDEIIEKNEQYRHLAEKLTLLKEQLTKVRSLDARQQNNIIVTILADATAETEVSLSYTLSTATWRTAYDAELTRETATVRLACYGEILQKSGEDWTNVKLILSTAAGERSIELPQIFPVYLSGYKQKREKTVIQEDREIKEELPVGAMTGTEPEPADEAPLPDAQPRAATKTAAKGTAYTFDIQRPATIPPDGHWHKVLINQQEIPAQVSYETIPEIMEYVYLRASLVNSLGLPLLPGRLAIYRNKSYIGQSTMKYTAPDGPLAISFGIDNDLRVKRIVYRNTQRPATLLNNKNVYEKEIRFILYNYKTQPEKILLKEGIYVSEIKDISIDLLDETTSGYTTDKEGVVQWTVDLPVDPFRHTELKLCYKINAPKSFNLEF